MEREFLRSLTSSTSPSSPIVASRMTTPWVRALTATTEIWPPLTQSAGPLRPCEAKKLTQSPWFLNTPKDCHPRDLQVSLPMPGLPA